MRISVFTSEPLQAAITGVKRLPREFQKAYRRALQSEVGPIWKQEVGARPANKLVTASLIKTATTSVRSNNVLLQSGGKGKLAKRLPAKAVEFGADQNVEVTYTATSPKGKRHPVTRHTQRQLPTFARKGRVIYQAAAKTIPRMARIMVQTAARSIHESIEGK